MPKNPTDVHSALLDALSPIDSIRSIQLVARLHDPRIGNDNDDRLYLFLPDLHLVTRSVRLTKFPHGFHHERMLVDVLKELINLNHACPELHLTVIQLGDFLDLWKEAVEDPVGILQDYWGIYAYLYAMDPSHSLDARMIIGNHDASLAAHPIMSAGWDFRLFLPGDSESRIYVTHGDVFDWVEELPDSLQKFAVYYLENSPLRVILDSGANDLHRFIKFRGAQKWMVSDDVNPELGAIFTVSSDLVFPNPHNVQSDHRFLQKCMDRVQTANQDYGMHVVAAVIGHTHQARIAVHENPFFVLMDCGAWKGSYQTDDGAHGPNCQIGAICGNDFRIYQLDPDPSVSPEIEPATVV